MTKKFVLQFKEYDEFDNRYFWVDSRTIEAKSLQDAKDIFNEIISDSGVPIYEESRVIRERKVSE